MASSSSNQPNVTLYINNLNDKVNKDELKSIKDARWDLVSASFPPSARL